MGEGEGEKSCGDVGTFRVSFNSSIDMGIEGNQEPIGLILMKDFDSLGIGLVIEEVYISFDQFDGGFIDSAVKRDGSVAVDFPSGSGAEEVGELFGGGPQEVKVLGVPIPGCFSGGAKDGSMVGLITPVFESFVESGQSEGGRKKGKKLHSDGFEETLNYPFSLRPVGGTVNEGDPEGGCGASQLMRAKRRPKIAINLSGESPFAQGLDQTIGQVFEVFLQIELSMSNVTGVVIQEGEEKTLTHLPLDDHWRPMHTIGLPEIIGKFGSTPPEIRFVVLRFV